MVEYAPLRSRLLAALIDYGFLFGLDLAYLLLFGEDNLEGGLVVKGFAALPPFGFWFVYFPIIEGLTGQTVGKRVFDIMVIRDDRRDFTLGDGFLRRIVDFIDLAFFGLVGIIVAYNSDKRQRVSDMIAKTIVVSKTEIRCSVCHELLNLSRSEYLLGEFVCPVCETVNHMKRNNQ
ncbi:MAG TPA: RDD family protein [Cyclobacteriaceae bacterium]|nr:RDD family protein [Cyclobacteriaceae bacterium]